MSRGAIMNETKSKLSQLAELANSGVGVIIVKVVRKPGRFQGAIKVAEGFDITPDDVIAGFEGTTVIPATPA
ncbi:MAG: hypothetical protein ACI8WB_005103 [Phenylobacterium sp.]|jgi:hypothetical protein